LGTASDLVPARAAAPSHAPGSLKPHDNSARTLHLRDSTWNQVRVEVRVGPDRTCDALGSLGVQVLQQGQEWEVQFDEPVICWRRDETPGDPASRWTAWDQLRLADGEIRVVTL
ncbi:MAG: hypothetical protein ACREA0_25725, partial [bacterium]